MPDLENSASLDNLAEVKVTEEEELSDEALDSVSGGYAVAINTGEAYDHLEYN